MSTVLSIVFLVIITLVSGYFLYSISSLKKQLSGVNSDVEGLRKDIQTKADIEIKARNLDKKFSSLQLVFDQQYKYSLLLQEVRSRKPQFLDIESMDLKAGKMNVTGKADNYISIAEFINNLLNHSFTGGTKGLENLFTSVSLNSVSLENTENRIQFFIVVDFDPTLLKK